MFQPWKSTASNVKPVSSYACFCSSPADKVEKGKLILGKGTTSNFNKAF